MHESDGEPREIYVQPGESHVVHGAAILRTVLGSCVGVTFWNQRLGVGALCHPMLPTCPKTTGPLSVAAARRYVDFTIRDLARQLDALGALRIETEVKIFGGADVLRVQKDGLRPTVGKLNCDIAIRVLRSEGFDVAASRLRGDTGCHIEFHTATGEVRLRQLS